MGQKIIACSFCGSKNDSGAIYCNSCGKEIGKTLSGTENMPGDLDKTVLMSPGSEPEKEDLSSTASGQPELDKTILDPNAVQKAVKDHQAVRATPGQKHKDPVPAAPAARAAPAGNQNVRAAPGGEMKKTMLGQSPFAAQSQQQQKVVQAPSAQKEVKKTVLGLPAATASEIEAYTRQAESGQKAPAQEDLKETLQASESQEIPEEAQISDSSVATEEVQDPGDSGDFSGEVDYGDEVVEQKRIPPWVFITAGVGAVVILGVVVILLILNGKLEHTYQITPLPDGTNIAISINVPDAPAGSSIVFMGRQEMTVNGLARFEIPLEQIKLGENTLSAQLRRGDSTDMLGISINRRHKVGVDLKGLGADPPFFECIFTLAPGESLSVAGQSAVLDSQNSFRFRMNLTDALANGRAEDDHLLVPVPFQLQHEGGKMPDSGEYVARLPLTRLRVDRPAPDAVVDLSILSCSGETEEEASVSVNGKRAAVIAGRFEVKIPLETIGENMVEVVSRAPGKAPRTLKLNIKRVKSLQPEAEAYIAGSDSDLDYPTLGRDPETYIGKKIKISGRIVNIRTEQGVTVFILYVSEGCPSESRCALYVVFRGESGSSGLYSWVSVYGEVKGKKDVQIREGVSLEVPAIEAVYVIPEKKKRKSRKRRSRRRR